MGRIIAVTNIKGGIGKTTTVINVGAGLALMGVRVLLVDADAQGNLAISLGVSPNHTLSEVLMEDRQVSNCLTPARHNLDLLAADDTLLSAQIAFSNKPNWARTLQQRLQPIKAYYDIIFIDAPGSLTPMTMNALFAADEIIVPTTVEHLSIKGLTMLLRQIHHVTSRSNLIRMIVPTMYDTRLRQSVELLDHLIQTYGSLVAEPIRINNRLSEATAKGQTIYEYDARSRGSLDYAGLVNRLSEIWNLSARAPSSPPPEASSSPTPLRHLPAAPAAPPSPPAPAPTSRGGRREATLPHTCPYCGKLLKRTTLAGYRVVYCEHCKYKQQGEMKEMHR